jgi:hypothetical protein
MRNREASLLTIKVDTAAVWEVLVSLSRKEFGYIGRRNKIFQCRDALFEPPQICTAV